MSKCISIRTPDFEKSLKKSGSQMAKKINESIIALESLENNPEKMPDGVKSPHLVYGKMLTQLNRNIYSLEASEKVRAFAVVVQKEGKKVYLWMWGGSHEDYNKMLKIEKLNSQERSVKSMFSEEIEKQFISMTADDTLKKRSESMIHSLRKKSYGDKIDNSYKP
jgi:site-specific recombinase XerD